MLSRSGQLVSKAKCFHTSTVSRFQGELRSDGWWVKDHKPSKFPRTSEQRAAAAAKYGLRPEDYKPYPLDEGSGSYPDLGVMTFDHKDPYENWTHDRFRRNFGEPTSLDFHSLGPDRDTFTGAERRTRPQIVKIFLGVIIGYFTFFYLLAKYDLRHVVPMTPKQFPYDMDKPSPFSRPLNYPQKFYSFELESAESHDDHHH